MVGDARAVAPGRLGPRSCHRLVVEGAFDPGYIDEAQWIVDYIVKPLHPMAVWLVSDGHAAAADAGRQHAAHSPRRR